MQTIDIMKQVMARIEAAFTTLPDNQRSYEINGHNVTVKYDGWYKWCVTSICYESGDHEHFHECLQDALRNAVQTIKDYHWIRMDKGEITQDQYNEFLDHGGNYVW